MHGGGKSAMTSAIALTLFFLGLRLVSPNRVNPSGEASFRWEYLR